MRRTYTGALLFRSPRGGRGVHTIELPAALVQSSQMPSPRTPSHRVIEMIIDAIFQHQDELASLGGAQPLRERVEELHRIIQARHPFVARVAVALVDENPDPEDLPAQQRR